jgi:hypothetical protein
MKAGVLVKYLWDKKGNRVPNGKEKYLTIRQAEGWINCGWVKLIDSRYKIITHIPSWGKWIEIERCIQ